MPWRRFSRHSTATPSPTSRAHSLSFERCSRSCRAMACRPFPGNEHLGCLRRKAQILTGERTPCQTIRANSGLPSPAPRGQAQRFTVDRLARARVEIQDGEIQLDAQIIADGFDLEPARIPALMRDGAITSLCECGIDEDAGRYRLTFFHKSRRFRLSSTIRELSSNAGSSISAIGHFPPRCITRAPDSAISTQQPTRNFHIALRGRRSVTLLALRRRSREDREPRDSPLGGCWLLPEQDVRASLNGALPASGSPRPGQGRLRCFSASNGSQASRSIRRSAAPMRRWGDYSDVARRAVCALSAQPSTTASTPHRRSGPERCGGR